ncbi:toluene hydroxylase [Pseudonocardia asaccharolytica]|uniref:propane 2-monooxygenase n=1 Tax=Pseudonocardia asaccharolytica DSM 44247 = NBRC 16224 TaxID=1123024 RepID=A0A511D3R9_9PSEU|nr:toluene hydroxylase [Pseudonocardia asaccharolytica]GEL19436.1 hypothetical protein PA7_32730 [Pseudonocardia asaccharolytica DSM 44247 = NBRC 16224]
MTPATSTGARRRARTWSLLGDVRRKVTPYEAVTAKFHYHFRRDPAPFELDPEMSLNRWYLRHRENSPFQVDDWEDFRDPFKLTYKDYVSLQHERELYLDGLVDQYEVADVTARLDEGWVETLRRLFVPLRFPLHALQMISLYVGQMAPSSFITNPASFQAADEMRRIQRLAYWTKVLGNTHGDHIATTAAAHDPWAEGGEWQPLRETVERLLVTYDWGEAFVGLNLAVKPALDTLIDWQLGELADRNGDVFLSLLFSEFERDARRSREWSAALVDYALTRDPGLRGVVTGWLDVWTPSAERACDGLAPLFEKAPEPIPAADVASAVRAQLAQLRTTCGL